VEQSACETARLSSLLANAADAPGRTMPASEKAMLEAYAEFEREFFAENQSAHRARSADELARFYAVPSLTGLRTRELNFSISRSIASRDLQAWFGPDSKYGKALRGILGEETSERLGVMVGSLRSPVDWPCSAIIFQGILSLSSA
jgi:hypothetical protein